MAYCVYPQTLPKAGLKSAGSVIAQAVLQSGRIAWTEFRTVLKSPLARDIVWLLEAGFMYAGDQ